jgi:hypothetical protein
MFACGGNESETLRVVSRVPVETGLDWVTVSGTNVGIEQYDGLSLGSKLSDEPGRRIGAAPDNVQPKMMESRGLSLGDLVIQLRPVINSIRSLDLGPIFRDPYADHTQVIDDTGRYFITASVTAPNAFWVNRRSVS